MDTKNLQELSFEAALKGLEEIVEKLSSSSNELEEMLRLYAEGVKYLKHCQAQLGEAEARIKILSAEISGKIEEN